MKPEMQVRGLQELLADMRGLPAQVQARAMKGAVATGCSVIRLDAIARAPEYTGSVQQGHPPPGTLKRAIYQARMPSLCTENLETWIVSVKQGQKAADAKGGSRDAYYATWVEWGHYTRGVGARSAGSRRDVASGAAVPLGTYSILPHPYMRPAFDAQHEAATAAMAAYLKERIPLIWAKQGFS